MNMNNSEFDSFLFSQIRKAMDHLKIQKPRLYAIRYWKIHEVFQIHSFHTGRERERDLPGFSVGENREERLFGLKENEYGSFWNEWSGEGKWKVSVWMSFVFIDFKVPRGGINDLFYFFLFIFHFQNHPLFPNLQIKFLRKTIYTNVLYTNFLSI